MTDNRRPSVDPFMLIWAVIATAALAAFLYLLVLLATRT